MIAFARWCVVALVALTCFGVGDGVAADETSATSVEVVVRSDADELERFAAEELQRYLKRLFDVTASIVKEPTPSAEAFFLLDGSGVVETVIVDLGGLGTGGLDRTLPSPQSFLLQKTQRDGNPAMVILGGSPRAVLWGVYELVERWGVRYLLSGDVFPEGQQTFSLPEIDQLFEPTLKMRWFKTMGDFAMGMEGWGIDDYRPFIDQLAKLKFNRIRIGGCPTGPFLDLTLRDVKRQSATLWYDEHYPITPDMPGRKLFGDATEFWNPDLLTPDATYDELIEAGRRHQHALIAYAKSRGIEASAVWSLVDFPKDLSEAIPDPQPVHQLGYLTVSPGPTVRPDDPRMLEIGGTVLRTILNEYSDADSHGFPAGTEFPSWVDLYAWAWQELDKQYGIEQVVPLDEVLRRAEARPFYWGPTGRALREAKGHITGLYFLLRLWNDPDILPKSQTPDCPLVVYEVAEELWPILPRVLPKNSELAVVMDYNPTRVLRRRDVLATLPGKEIPTTMVLTLHDDSVGMLPMLTTSALHEIVGEMRKAGVQGFCTRQWLIGDHDPSVTYLAKAAWDSDVTPGVVKEQIIRDVCGEAAVAPMLEMFQEVERVTTALEDHGMALTFPEPGMMRRQWNPAPMEKELVDDRATYQRALDAVAKTPTPSQPEGKAYLAYWKGRLQFAVRYFDAIEESRKGAMAEKAAADAKATGDEAAYRKHLAEAAGHAEAAAAAVFESLEAYAAVARDRADAGAIATMAEYSWRLLKTKAQSLAGDARR